MINLRESSCSAAQDSVYCSRALAGALGVYSLDEVARQRSIVLPHLVHQEMYRAIRASQEIMREQWVAWKGNRNQLIVAQHGCGKGMNIDTLGLEADLPRDVSGMLSGHYALYYHVHPQYTQAYFDAHNMKDRWFTEKTGGSRAEWLAVKQTVDMAFSPGDLDAFEQVHSHIQAFAVGHESGYRLIINPKAFGSTAYSEKPLELYQKRMKDLIGLQWEAVFQGHHPNKEAYQRSADLYLRSYCQDSGYIALAGKDPRSSVLTVLT